MVALRDQPYLSAEAYLAWEAEQSQRHEYVFGETYAMAGGTLNHNRVIGNLYLLLRERLRGTNCQVFTSDVKTEVSEWGPYFYPDVVVTCDPRDRAIDPQQSLIRFPCLIIEVLSPSTQSYDKTDKFKFYQRIPTLQEIVLVDLRFPNLMVYRRVAPNQWQIEVCGPVPNAPNDLPLLDLEGWFVDFRSLDFPAPLGLIYEDVIFPHSSPPPPNPAPRSPNPTA
jgi:Uma2 family endonuclease